MGKNYVPFPIDTKEIVVPSFLLQLVEQLAKHNHDLWAKQRIVAGWKYGKNRNDKKLEHPCLIPYDDLPEAEKEIDRITALGIIKAIMKLGYKISET